MSEIMVARLDVRNERRASQALIDYAKRHRNSIGRFVVPYSDIPDGNTLNRLAVNSRAMFDAFRRHELENQRKRSKFYQYYMLNCLSSEEARGSERGAFDAFKPYMKTIQKIMADTFDDYYELAKLIKRRGGIPISVLVGEYAPILFRSFNDIAPVNIRADSLPDVDRYVPKNIERAREEMKDVLDLIVDDEIGEFKAIGGVPFLERRTDDDGRVVRRATSDAELYQTVNMQNPESSANRGGADYIITSIPFDRETADEVRDIETAEDVVNRLYNRMIIAPVDAQFSGELVEEEHGGRVRINVPPSNKNANYPRVGLRVNLRGNRVTARILQVKGNVVREAGRYRYDFAAKKMLERNVADLEDYNTYHGIQEDQEESRISLRDRLSVAYDSFSEAMYSLQSCLRPRYVVIGGAVLLAAAGIYWLGRGSQKEVEKWYNIGEAPPGVEEVERRFGIKITGWREGDRLFTGDPKNPKVIMIYQDGNKSLELRQEPAKKK